MLLAFNRMLTHAMIRHWPWRHHLCYAHHSSRLSFVSRISRGVIGPHDRFCLIRWSGHARHAQHPNMTRKARCAQGFTIEFHNVLRYAQYICDQETSATKGCHGLVILPTFTSDRNIQILVVLFVGTVPVYQSRFTQVLRPHMNIHFSTRIYSHGSIACAKKSKK